MVLFITKLNINIFLPNQCGSCILNLLTEQFVSHYLIFLMWDNRSTYTIEKGYFFNHEEKQSSSPNDGDFVIVWFRFGRM